MTTLRELIAQHCADLGDDYPAIANRLNAPTVIDNPQTEPATVSWPPTLKDVLAVVPSAERLAIRKQLLGFVDDVRRAIDTADADYMAVLIQDALTDNAISIQTATALALLVERTQSDPAWSATIPGPSIAAAAGFGTISAADIQAAMNL